MNGAAASTCSCFDASPATRCQSRSFPSTPLNWTWEATPRMRVRISRWNPFITDSTVISTVMPSATPSTETSEMNEMKWLRRLARV